MSYQRNADFIRCPQELITIDPIEPTRFDVAEPATAVAPITDVAGDTNGNQPRVLHVDDEPDFVEMTSIFLERIQDEFTVTTETSSLVTLDRLDEEQIDCIISDYQMPRMDGLELLEAVREEHPDLPFILCTARGSEEVASEAIAKGVTDYIQKGTDTRQYEILANRVSNAIDQYRTRQQLWDSMAFAQSIFDQDVVGLFVVQDDIVVHANEHLAETFGYEVDDLLGESTTVFDARSNNCVDRPLAAPTDGDGRRCTAHTRTGEPLELAVHVAAIAYRGKPATLCLVATDGGAT